MNPISFACPFCSGVFQVDQQQAATQVYCPHCEKVIDLPTQLEESLPSTTTPDPASSKPGSTSNKQRASRKKPVPQSPDNKNLFPPGYVPDSPPTPLADSQSTSTAPPEEPPEPVASTSPSVPDTKPTSEPTTRHSDPPGAALPRPTGASTSPSKSAAEALLPPGVTSQSSGSPNTTDNSLPSTDHLLPPAVSAGESKEDLFSGIDAGSHATLDNSAEEPHTPQIALLDPVKTVEKHGQEIELKQRTPEEKIRWKLRKNLVLWISGILILLITLYVMKN